MSNFFTETAALIFAEPFKQKIGRLELHLTIRRIVSEKNEVTQNPIESGSPITDHVRKQPTEITIDGMVSEFSLKNSILSSALRGENPFTSKNTLKDAFDELNRINDVQQPITLQMPYRAYPNMLLQNLDFPADAQSGKALYFSCQFIKMNIVTSQTVTVSPVKGDTAKPKVKLGKQPATPVTPTPKSTITLGQFLRGLF